MLLLGTAHIGEVQSSIWDEETVRICRERGVHLL
jgi:aspartate--ammonia ligase